IAIEGLNWKKSFIAGLASAPDGSLFAADINQNCIYRVNPDSGHVLTTGATGYRPGAIAFSPDAKILAVANWGGESVSFLDPQTLKEQSRVKVGSHPADLLRRNDGRLFVACAGTNSVNVIDAAAAEPKVIEVIRTSLDA